jgi:uncharacterized membrane protein YdjX (TVP38/TMEM64 family)
LRAADPRAPRRRFALALAAAAILALLAAATWLVARSPLPALLADPERLRAAVEQAGVLGPVAIIAALALAVVVSPIPSAPIAVAAGAAYGTVWGTVYVVAGAQCGALIAFGLARHFGFDAARRWPATARILDGVRSQAALAAIVFASRLLPFLSFDAVSYAAGLTRLRWPQFAVATMAGVAPVSLLLAWFGDSAATTAPGTALWLVLLAGGVTLLPLGVAMLRRRWRRAAHAEGPPRDGDGPSA